MNTTAEIYLWGTRIGIIHQEIGHPYASFEYDKDFLKSGIEIFPLKMPLSERVYEFPLLAEAPFFGLPGLVSDSLPDDFGNSVIEAWLSAQGKSITDFTAIDRLCYTGKRGMGALEFVPSTTDTKDTNSTIKVSKMVEFASEILKQRGKLEIKTDEKLQYSKLVQIGSSAGGARAKALIAWNETTNIIKSGQLKLDKGFDYWLIKFDNVTKNGDHGLVDDPQYTLIEYAYYKMALASGINMQECRIFKDGNSNHFMTKRFDRANGEKIHMLSLGALTHISYKKPAECSYEMAVQYMRQMDITQKDIIQFYRRMVFNCIAVNQDDHVKNISFLMGKDGVWKLSPAYDITFSYNPYNKWPQAHQMTVNSKTTDINVNDLITSGINMGINKRKCISIINEVKKVVMDFNNYADEVGLNNKTKEAISSVLMNNLKNY